MHRLVLCAVTTATALIFLACGSELDNGTGSASQTDTGASVVNDTNLPDEDVVPPCKGLKVEPNASTYDEECAGVTECTDMPDKSSGCYCAYCGPKGTKVLCYQAQCATPGNG
jgi:hypothetical protein